MENLPLNTEFPKPPGAPSLLLLPRPETEPEQQAHQPPAEADRRRGNVGHDLARAAAQVNNNVGARWA